MEESVIEQGVRLTNRTLAAYLRNIGWHVEFKSENVRGEKNCWAALSKLSPVIEEERVLSATMIGDRVAAG